MALGGMMTAVAVVIMTLGSLIPVNTYICPVLCILLCRTVLDLCGKKIAWCFYMAVTEKGTMRIFTDWWLKHSFQILKTSHK